MEELKNIGFYTLSNERARNASETSQMKRCEMIITEYCNFRCAYCRKLNPIVWDGSKIKQSPIEDIKHGIDLWCESSPVENIRFSGGEPTLHKDIREVVSYSKSKGINRIAISTNGSNKLSLYKELIDLGVNDFSISLDGCCAEDVNFMAGGIKGAFDIITTSIRELSKLTYVTVGIVLTPDNISRTLDVIRFADDLGVADIRVIPSAQYNKPIEALAQVSDEILNRHPILKFRVNSFKNGDHVRGLKETDSPMCGLVLDDSVIVGKYHFPCIIAFREHCKPIGKVGPNMRQERKEWMMNHNPLTDPICSTMCLDACSNFNCKFREYHPELFASK
jgi:uncharacterized Fe-S cluster-containing radical SAM superfamily protein